MSADSETFTYRLHGHELIGEFVPYDDTPVFGPPTLRVYWLHLTALKQDGDEKRVLFHDVILTTRKPSEITLLAAAAQFIKNISISA